MKLNNKGLTITELLVSIALVSVVMIFVYMMLDSVNDDYYNSDFAINNQTIRLEIIKSIQNNLLDETVENITYNNNEIIIEYINKSSSINITSESLIFINKNGIKTKWTMDEAYISNDVLINSAVVGEHIKYEINIPIYTDNNKNNSINNNKVDDIIINYYGLN